MGAAPRTGRARFRPGERLQGDFILVLLASHRPLYLAALLQLSTLPAAHAQQGAGLININGQFVLAAKAGQTQRVAALLRRARRPGDASRVQRARATALAE